MLKIPKRKQKQQAIKNDNLFLSSEATASKGEVATPPKPLKSQIFDSEILPENHPLAKNELLPPTYAESVRSVNSGQSVSSKVNNKYTTLEKERLSDLDEGNNNGSRDSSDQNLNDHSYDFESAIYPISRSHLDTSYLFGAQFDSTSRGRSKTTGPILIDRCRSRLPPCHSHQRAISQPIPETPSFTECAQQIQVIGNNNASVTEKLKNSTPADFSSSDVNQRILAPFLPSAPLLPTEEYESINKPTKPESSGESGSNLPFTSPSRLAAFLNIRGEIETDHFLNDRWKKCFVQLESGEFVKIYNITESKLKKYEDRNPRGLYIPVKEKYSVLSVNLKYSKIETQVNSYGKDLVFGIRSLNGQVLVETRSEEEKFEWITGLKYEINKLGRSRKNCK